MSDQGNNIQPDGLSTFDHVVVLMLENRSFDNLLGYLYPDGPPAGKSFEGLQTGNYANPVPARAVDSDQHKSIAPSRAADYHQPYPDPGEEYQHVNTQLFNHIDEDNLNVEAYKMKAPFNIPDPTPSPAPMNGFVNDYVSNLHATYDKAPTLNQYEVIMQCFQNDQVNVLSTLAKEFAVFDHWHCSVPSQTWCNRAFWNAATSGGKVINALDEHGGGIGGAYHDAVDMISWVKNVWTKPTIFDRMSEKKVSWGIYAPTALLSLTNIIHGVVLEHPLHLHNYSTFLSDLKNGTLPEYSFVEPQFLKNHNDQHPSAAGHPDGPGTVYLGEELILQVYNAIKESQYKDNTLFIITHDEHGGCFDHVNPPAAAPPVPNMKGQNGFQFNRLGIRVPMVMISSFIQPGTIVNDDFDHTSFIKTMSNKWGLEGLTDRDKNANSFEHVFSSEKRSSWPDIDLSPLPLNTLPQSDSDKDPLNDLQSSIMVGVKYLVSEKKKTLTTGVTADSEPQVNTIGEAMAYIESVKHLL